jgi:uncharacterized membrane protein YcaP (DUF421 family)
MDTILRAAAVYFFLVVVFRLAGKRNLAETSNFELVVLLIISETIQQAVIDHDESLTNAAIAIITLVAASIAMSWLKQRFPLLDRWLEGTPVMLVENGRIVRRHLHEARITGEELLAAARRDHGVERLEDIKFAVLEPGGQITTVPYRRGGDPAR